MEILKTEKGDWAFTEQGCKRAYEVNGEYTLTPPPERVAYLERQRQVMDQMKALYDELDDDSNLKAAFAGSFEFAKWNLDHDDYLSFPLELERRNLDIKSLMEKLKKNGGDK